jgi:hypothetical protein
MKTNTNLILVLVISSLGVFSFCGFGKSSDFQTKNLNSAVKSSDQRSRYTNDQYGFTFSYPENFKENINEHKVFNKEEVLVAIEVNLLNPLSDQKMEVKYYPNSMNQSFYKYALSQINPLSDVQLTFHNNEIILRQIQITKNGKGKELNNPIVFFIANFFNENGEVEIHFKAPLQDKNLIELEIKQTLSSFTFLK